MYGKHRSLRDRSPLRQFCAIALLGLFVAIVGTAGCGVDVENLLLSSAGALGRTYVDLMLTDIANAVADANADNGDAGNGDANGGEPDGGDGDGGGDDVPFDQLTGDPAAGESLYASCVMCHCADGSGGCLPGAPAVIGASAEILDDRLRGSGTHVPSDVTNQEIVDLEAYLASLGGVEEESDGATKPLRDGGEGRRIGDSTREREPDVGHVRDSLDPGNRPDWWVNDPSTHCFNSRTGLPNPGSQEAKRFVRHWGAQGL